MDKTSPARIIVFTALLLILVVVSSTLADQVLKFLAMILTAFLTASAPAAEVGTPSASRVMMEKLSGMTEWVTFLIVASLVVWVLRRWLNTPLHARFQFLKTMFLYIALTAGVTVALFPFFWMICTSFKPAGQELKFNEKKPFDVVPPEPTILNFKKVFNMNQGVAGPASADDIDSQKNFSTYFFNSMKVATTAAFFVTLFAAMAGYALAKKEFPYKGVLFKILMGTFMIPGMMYMVPQFFIVCKMGLFGTQWAMFLPHLASVFGVFMLKQYMETIPSSLIEAARIDGASEWQIFRVVIVPLCMPILLTLFLLTFLFHWSNFLWQLVVTDPEDPLSITLPVGLALFRGQYTSDLGLMMSASCFSIIPITILFLFAQRYFIEGMTQGGVKE